MANVCINCGASITLPGMKKEKVCCLRKRKQVEPVPMILGVSPAA